MEYLLIVKADTNDGDYVYQRSKFTEDQLVKLNEVVDTFNKLKEVGGFSPSWCVGEICDEDEAPEIIYEGELTERQIDLIHDYTPYGEHGIHTIDEVTLYKVTELEEII